MAKKTLSAVFLCAALAAGAAAGLYRLAAPAELPPAPAPVTAPEHTYWRPPGYPVILDIWKCPETGLCGGVHWMDPEDRNMKYAASLLLGKKLAQTTPEDVLGFCGYRAQILQMKEAGFNPYVKLGPWAGKIDTPAGAFNIELQDTQQGTLDAYGYAGCRWIGGGITFERVAHPPPACRAPAPSS